jgi:hypothetical protein
MKTITGLLVGVAMLASASAQAHYYGQASVSGEVLSYGPRGFILEGPDGNYGIEVGTGTVVTDTWNTFLVTGQGGVQPGDWVTATGYPTSQWIMRASRVVVRSATPPPVYPPNGSYYGSTVVPGSGIVQGPTVITPFQQRVTNLGTLSNSVGSTLTTLPAPISNMAIVLNPFSLVSSRR